MLRSRAGTLHRLEPTATMLGVLAPEAFEPGARRMAIVPGDAIVAYTDGLPETRDGEGREFGIRRVEEICLSAAGEGGEGDGGTRLAAALVEEAARHREEGARVTDDTLVVEISLMGRGARVEVEAAKEVASR
jgi:hypothetical protein